jgi:hypothetical protein
VVLFIEKMIVIIFKGDKVTDKQIACVYLSHRLWGVIPDHDELRDIADTKLSEERCVKICERITEMCMKIREPLVDHLNSTGMDAT